MTTDVLNTYRVVFECGIVDCAYVVLSDTIDYAVDQALEMLERDVGRVLAARAKVDSVELETPPAPTGCDFRGGHPV